MRQLGLLQCSRSSKVTEFGTNRKLICDFLLVINTNLAPTLHRFRDIAFDRSKIAIFGYRSCVGNPINSGPKFLYHVKHSAKPDTNHSTNSTNPTNPTNPTTKYRV